MGYINYSMCIYTMEYFVLEFILYYQRQKTGFKAECTVDFSNVHVNV